MLLYLSVLALVLTAFLVRRVVTPPCPRCRSKKWDRSLCQPLLFCRRCATRIDAHGRVYN